MQNHMMRLRMLEIVFDENACCEFLGQKCEEIFPVFPEISDFSSYRKLAKQIIDDNPNQRALVIHPAAEGEQMNLLALALSVETYAEQTNLEDVVFKVRDCRMAIEAYRPFMALANSLRYARDLLRLDADERIADIKRLGYLGLKIKEDYINNLLELDWAGTEPVRNLSAREINSGLVLVGLMKNWAICKEKFAVHGIIGGEASGYEIPVPADEDEMIEKIVELARNNNYGN